MSSRLVAAGVGLSIGLGGSTASLSERPNEAFQTKEVYDYGEIPEYIGTLALRGAPEQPVSLVLDEPAEAGPATAVRVGNQVQLTEPPPPPPEPEPIVVPAHYGIWLEMVMCEANGNWFINTGNGFYGGLQFTLTSWRGAGGLFFAPRPDLATPLQQMYIAENLLSMQGWGAWPGCARKLGLR